jgi:uncharacterized protein (TIGR02271 family)
MVTDDQIPALIGAAVHDDGGAGIGTVAQVWVDAAGQPSWAGVARTGTGETLMPLAGASFAEGVLRVPYAKALVADAPHVGTDAEEPPDGVVLQALCEHYGLTLDTGVPPDTTAPGDDAMTRSEERLRVRLQQRPAGKVRLRKHVVTEYVTTTVPVRHEELRVEHVPLDDAAAETPAGTPDAEAGDSETETEIILYAERPVVTTETVPVERVRLGKRTVTEQQTVTGEVRKEQIELDRTED